VLLVPRIPSVPKSRRCIVDNPILEPHRANASGNLDARSGVRVTLMVPEAVLPSKD
jgi:hypothetical protein